MAPDYNLLRVFAALMEERSVTAAAARLGLTQASTSNALARLRATFDDRLLEREGNRMVPTLLARQLWSELRDPLHVVERSLRGIGAFEPADFGGELKIGVADYVLELFGEAIATTIRAEAPQAQVSLMPADPVADGEALFSDEMDILIGPAWRLAPGLARADLFTESFVGVVAREHPLAGREPTLDAFLEFPHILVSGRGIVPGNIDAALRKLGRSRRVALSTPSIASLPRLLAGTDRVVSLGRRLAADHAERHPVALFELPVVVDPFVVALAWHPRNTAGPQHRWLRALLARCTADHQA